QTLHRSREHQPLIALRSSNGCNGLVAVDDALHFATDPARRTRQRGRTILEGNDAEDLPMQLPLRCGEVRGGSRSRAALVSLQLFDLPTNTLLAFRRQVRWLSDPVG